MKIETTNCIPPEDRLVDVKIVVSKISKNGAPPNLLKSQEVKSVTERALLMQLAVVTLGTRDTEFCHKPHEPSNAAMKSALYARRKRPRPSSHLSSNKSDCTAHF
uniref:Uncharacterized protein n=1 Tax=Physcomitrium patens TaxID=3218 RepID=A0A2K1IXI4_PHYPA|nr:hypothetical protein PHYPA_023809 [Physcomitrium patens]